MNRKTETAWPSRTTLAKVLNVTSRAIYDAIKQLKTFHYLSVVANRGLGQTSLFRIILDEPNDDVSLGRKPNSRQARNQTSSHIHPAPVSDSETESSLIGSVVLPDQKLGGNLNGISVPGEHIEEPSDEPSERRKSPLRRIKTQIPMPEVWPSSRDRDWARQYLCDEGRADLAAKIDCIGAQCHDHHASKGSKSADWSATWRTWVRNETKFTKLHPTG
jgi:hypothetical protein